MKNIVIGDKIIGDDHPIYIVGEMAWAHDSKVENAKTIIKGCADAKCDAINFHVTHLEHYMVPHYSLDERSSSAFELQKKLVMPVEHWPEIFAYAKELGLDISALCNDLESVELVKKLDPDILMFHASCLTEEPLVRAIGKVGKPVFFAVGGSTITEILQAIGWLNEEGCDEIAILFGIQNYPTKLEDNNAKFLVTLKSMFERPIGFSDHHDADDPMALIVPLMGIPLGANIIEKHITYDRSKKGTDYFSSLNPDEMKIFVKNVRSMEKVIGSGKVRPFSEAEISYREMVRKKTIAIKNLKAGHVLTHDDVRFMRSTEGIPPDHFKNYVGLKLKKPVKKYDPITLDLFSE
ncbi:MAG: hypothetical protein FK730_13715 [Asgard group archaeon]|nr:hypothetical protein [Asgard group archaeon]